MKLTEADIERIKNIPVNFVIGKERSGTTLLQVLLNAHSNITAPPESRFIIRSYARFGSVKWTEKDIRKCCDDLYREFFFRTFWKVDKEELVATLLSLKEKLNYQLFCKIVFWINSGGEKDIKVIFDKNIIYYYFLPLLNKIFPEAKYIHLVRDYHANIVSHRRVFPMKKVLDIAYRWMKINMIIEEAKQKNSTRWITIKYESLVSDTATTMQEICKFAGLPYEENMIKDHTAKIYSKYNEENKQNKQFSQIHKTLFTPISLAHIDEWKKVMTEDEIAEAEVVAGGYAEKMYGYKRVSNTKNGKVNGFSLLKAKWKDKTVTTAARIAYTMPWTFNLLPPLWKLFARPEE